MVGEVPFARGMYCEVWVGGWEEGGKEGVDGKKAGVEKVSLGQVTPILLTQFFVGSLKSASNSQDTEDGAQGSTFINRLIAACSCGLLRPSGT